MSSNPCKVCGGTDLNLVDGFYYCVECGTQDVNVIETVVEQNLLSDGTFAHSTIKKLTTVLQDANEMSGEWNKWHAYNFVLAGLTEELLDLGAEPSVKTAVLWIWTKYIKMFQIKEVEDNKSQFVNESLSQTKEEENDDGALTDDPDNENDKSTISNNCSKDKSNKTGKMRRDLKIVTRGTLLTILYVALNLDKSDIQLSHLLRFIKEGRLSLNNCVKFIPKEINTKSIPHWKSFSICSKDYTYKTILNLAMTFFKELDLGVPLVPDLGKIICNYVKELCLPSEFKDLVFSIMNLIPCDFLNLNSRTKKTLVRVPDYEAVCMSYILVALKMCFGLDSEYELKVADEVDKINYDENYLKSYKLGSYSESTDRLFSFREWYQFLLFRKTILCKYYLPMARLYKQPVDGCVLMEHLKDILSLKRTIKLSDNVTMDILNKIPVDDNIFVIPKREFPATLTPMTTYTEVILQYLHDPDLRLLLSEDFSQYSLKYAINDLKLPENCKDSDNIIQGVSETNKSINPVIIGNLNFIKGNNTMVFVRNCENKNWLKTKPPKTDHVITDKEYKQSDKESDPGYNSSMDSVSGDIDETKSTTTDETKSEVENKEEKVYETFDEEQEGICIFDDNFNDIDKFYEEKKADTIVESNSITHDDYVNDFQDSKLDFNDNLSELGSINEEDTFNPMTFNRKATIDTLIEMACKKYKIQIPKEKEPRVRTKRKKDLEENIAGQTEPKKKKSDVQTGQNEPKVTDILASYYKNLENDILHQVSERVKEIIHNQSNQELMNNESDENNVHENLEYTRLETDDSKLKEDFTNGDTTPNASIISSIQPNLTINSTASDTDEEVPDDQITKIDPNFDPSTHDIEQLYVKLRESTDFCNSVNYEDDPELHEIIDKSIEKFEQNKTSKQKRPNDIDSEDSEDDIPLIQVANEKMSLLKKNKRTKQNLDDDYLVCNRELKQFNYWMRRYISPIMVRKVDRSEKFDIEITENCSKSFVFVIRECAAILDCSTFCLYKCMLNLEETLIRFGDGRKC